MFILESNNIGADGAKSISVGIEKNTGLNELNLSKYIIYSGR